MAFFASRHYEGTVSLAGGVNGSGLTGRGEVEWEPVGDRENHRVPQSPISILLMR
jgi:hypothetical protein